MSKRKLFDDEAGCEDDDVDEDQDDEFSENEGSMANFIVPDDQVESAQSESDYDSIFGSDSEVEAVSRPSSNKRKAAAKPAKRTPATAAVKEKRKAAAKNSKKTVFKEPGHSSYPVNEFSLTITKTGEDVGLESLDTIGKFIVDHCLKGGVSTEVASRYFVAGVHQLDVQEVERTSSTSLSTSSASTPPPSTSRINRMLDIARSSQNSSSSSSSQHSVEIQPDFISITPYEDQQQSEFYTLDRDGDPSIACAVGASFECPQQLEDMLVIVRKLRDERMQRMSGSGYMAVLDQEQDINQDFDDEQVTPSSPPPIPVTN
eukprot:gene37734-46561_t